MNTILCGKHSSCFTKFAFSVTNLVKKLLKISKIAKCTPFQICEWTMFVRCPFIDLKPKIRCSSSISKRWTRSSLFNVGKNDVLVRSMSNSANLAMGYTIFDVCLFEAKNRVFEFDYQKMSTFESIQ